MGEKRMALGTRSTTLARAQTELVASRLRALGWEVAVERRSSQGDRSLGGALTLARGMFTAELEAALESGAIDAAVHSLKDLPISDPAPTETIALGAVMPRGPRGDLLIVREATLRAAEAQPASRVLDRLCLELPAAVAPRTALRALAPGATLGSASPRRQSAALALRPDLICCAVRGSVERRLQRLLDGAIDAVVLAEAGIVRLIEAGSAPSEWSRLRAIRLDLDAWPTAPGQGALAVQVSRLLAAERLESIRSLDDEPTRRAVELERRVLQKLGGGCQLPLGASAGTDSLTVSLAETGWRERARSGLAPAVVVRRLERPEDDQALDAALAELRYALSGASAGGAAPPEGRILELAGGETFAADDATLPALDLVVTSSQPAARRLLRELSALEGAPRNVAALEVLKRRALPGPWPLERLEHGIATSSSRKAWPCVLVSSPTAAKVLKARTVVEPEWLRVPWCALGEGTARELLAEGVPPSLVARAESAERFAGYVVEHLPPEATLLLPQSQRAGTALAGRLRDAGREVIAWPAYTVGPRNGLVWPAAMPAPRHLLFTSPSAFEAWCSLRLPLPSERAWALGARTADALEAAGVGPVLVAEGADPEGVASLWRRFRDSQGEHAVEPRDRAGAGRRTSPSTNAP